ncbi:hypothetical protein KR044_011294 [Drosophila immigrans]|nr:hypothetical protein KR044_011294 [Drosophila immigrans]
MSNSTGIRSVFQWSIGKASSGGGIHNALDFTIDDAVNSQTLNGQIGIYNNGSQFGVHLSLDSVESSTPGTNFTCSNNFTFINGNHACFNSNYTFLSNAIYYLDVEIDAKTVRGYISAPQRNSTDINNTKLERTLIGEINWKNGLKHINPMSYWVSNSYGDSCKNLSEISAFTYPPVIYTSLIRTKTSFYSSYITNSTNCGPQNVFAMTSFSPAVTIYISRPPAQLIL